MLIAQNAQLGSKKFSRFDIYLVLVLRSGGSTILDWKIIFGAVGRKYLKLIGAMCARSFGALRPAKLDQWGLAGMNELDGFFEKPIAIK